MSKLTSKYFSEQFWIIHNYEVKMNNLYDKYGDKNAIKYDNTKLSRRLLIIKICQVLFLLKQSILIRKFRVGYFEYLNKLDALQESRYDFEKNLFSKGKYNSLRNIYYL